MNKNTPLPHLFDYIDYRQYLQDVYNSLRRSDKKFSYRSFARLAGSSSPNFLQLILKRTLNISPPGMAALAKNLGLRKKEIEYLAYLAGFDHAKTHDEKDAFYRKMLATRAFRAIKQLNNKQYEYYSQWYNPVVRELLIHPEYPGDPAWIADRIFPSVSTAKVKKSILLLKELKLVRWDQAAGKWVQIDTSISTPSEVWSVAVTNYHRSVIELGRQALDSFSDKERDIRSVTFGIPASRYPEIKHRVEAFWREILDSVSKETEPEEVFQLNMQLFPLTKKKRKRK